MKVRLPDKGSVRVADIDGSFLIGHQFSCLYDKRRYRYPVRG
jgi:hypothetical protein